jgi:hypothetical protein
LTIGGGATLKMLRRKSKMQFVKQEHNKSNAISLLNYLKHIAPQQQNFKAQRMQPQLVVVKLFIAFSYG